MVDKGIQVDGCRARSEVSRSAGFTLVELMVGLLVFTMIIASCFACLRVGNSYVDNARHYTRVSQIMQSEIERIRSMAWGVLTELPTADTEVQISSQFDDDTYDRYTLVRSISGTGNLRAIELTITWDDMYGRSHTRQYLTMYTKGGLYDYIQ